MSQRKQASSWSYWPAADDLSTASKSLSNTPEDDSECVCIFCKVDILQGRIEELEEQLIRLSGNQEFLMVNATSK